MSWPPWPAVPWARVIKASDFTDNAVGIIHATGPKLAKLAGKYAPLVPPLRALILRPDTPLEADVKDLIARQLDAAQSGSPRSGPASSRPTGPAPPDSQPARAGPVPTPGQHGLASTRAHPPAAAPRTILTAPEENDSRTVHLGHSSVLRLSAEHCDRPCLRSEEYARSALQFGGCRLLSALCVRACSAVRDIRYVWHRNPAVSDGG
jgi:hypothetical protein